MHVTCFVESKNSAAYALKVVGLTAYTGNRRKPLCKVLARTRLNKIIALYF